MVVLLPSFPGWSLEVVPQARGRLCLQVWGGGAGRVARVWRTEGGDWSPGSGFGLPGSVRLAFPEWGLGEAPPGLPEAVGAAFSALGEGVLLALSVMGA